MKILDSVAVVLIVSSICVSCGDAPKSDVLMEAQEVHKEVTRLSANLHDAMMTEASSIQADMEEAVVANDTALMAELVALEGLLMNWDERFHDWNATVVEVPGMEVDHDHYHDHSGHDHDHSGHDHDHSGHDHGHHETVSLEGMSDDEILAIQQALLAELETLRALFDESISRTGSAED